MTKKYTIKEIINLAKEICESLDDTYYDVNTSDAYSFALNMQILIETMKDLEEI